MSTQKAVLHKSAGVAEIRSDVPLPKLRDDYILVKTKALALNPTDWKSLAGRPSPGAIVGCDYAGIVEAVGAKVTTPFKVGDRVAGFVKGGTVFLDNESGFDTDVPNRGPVQP
jgi:NADPH:quinone reductase-like Zn-dependent oxidoreductase